MDPGPPTPPPLQTFTPTTSFSGSTATSITFLISNTDDIAANIAWQIRQGSETGTIVAQATQTNVSSNGSFSATATSIASSTTYFLVNVFATASGKTQSDEAVRRSGSTTAPPPPPQPTATPFFSNIVTGNTSISFRANLGNIETTLVTVTRNGTQIFSQTLVPSTSFATINDGGLASSTSFTYVITATATGKTASTAQQVITTDTPPPPPPPLVTAQPFFSNITSTTNSISFRANNDDVSTVSMMVTNSSTQDVLFSGNVSGSGFVNISQSSLPAGTSFVFNINVQATGRDPNNRTQTISTSQLPQTATPTTGTQTSTSNSVTFNVTNNETSVATISWQIRQGTQSGTIVASGSSNVSPGASILPSAFNLSSSTTFWFVNVFATAFGKTQSNEGTRRSLNTLAAPQVPAVPASATISSPSANTVNLSWPAVSGATSYEYNTVVDGVNGSTENTTETSVNNVSVSAGQVNFRVRACNANGCSLYRNSGTVTVTGFTFQ